MTDTNEALLDVAKALARRLRLFRKLADQAGERDEQVCAWPCELWEPADQAALDKFEAVLADMKSQDASPPAQVRLEETRYVVPETFVPTQTCLTNLIDRALRSQGHAC